MGRSLLITNCTIGASALRVAHCHIWLLSRDVTTWKLMAAFGARRLRQLSWPSPTVLKGTGSHRRQLACRSVLTEIVNGIVVFADAHITVGGETKRRRGDDHDGILRRFDRS